MAAQTSQLEIRSSGDTRAIGIRTKGLLLAIFSAVAFSFKPLFTKVAYKYGVSAMDLIALRVWLGLPFSLLIHALIEGRRGFVIPVHTVVGLSAISIIGLAGSMIGSFLALERLPMAIASVLVFLYPILTIFVLAVWLQKSLYVREILCAGFSLAGIWLLSDPSFGTVLSISGIVLAVFAALCYALYGAAIQIRYSGITPLQVSTVGGLSVSGLLLVALGPVAIPGQPEALMALIGLTTISGVVPFLCTLYAIRYLGAGQTALVQALSPALVSIWGVLFLGEFLSPGQQLGVAVIVMSIVYLKAGGLFAIHIGTPTSLAGYLAGKPSLPRYTVGIVFQRRARDGYTASAIEPQKKIEEV